ncbi:MAG: M56 family metallopeptidase [Cyanobacteriota bacterium]|nr:M56 family metallopeptidase [Cyanobacteriota bacterium]
MHLGILFLAASLIILVRVIALRGNPRLAYGAALAHFALPPLILLTTALAIVAMGNQGEMWGMALGRGSYLLAWAFLGVSLLLLFLRLFQLTLTLRRLDSYRIFNLGTHTIRLLPLAFPYSAQIGFWRPQLVVSQGMIDLLSPEHLKAVLAHEAAHAQYRDTFCFFWLGWLRQLTPWLPYSEALWQELLLLREIRADHWAAERQDPLLLAEALTFVNQAIHQPLGDLFEPSLAIPFHQRQQRFLTRINSLVEPALSDSLVKTYSQPQLLALFSLTLIPFLFIPLHYG